MHIEVRNIVDIDTLMRWRREVIACVFGDTDLSGADAAALWRAGRAYYLRHLSDRSHLAFVASVDGREAGCAAVCFHDEMPSPDNISGRCAYIMNVYVRERFRNHGVASALVRHITDIARGGGVGKIYLESVAGAVPFYRSLGFAPMEGMMKFAGGGSPVSYVEKKLN